MGRRSTAPPSGDDGAVVARHASVELARQHPELWGVLNRLTLAGAVDWQIVLQTLRSALEGGAGADDGPVAEKKDSPSNT